MTYYSIPPTSDELYHYGIKGMKWGIRKYQNEDGSLTPAGERRYQNVDKAYHDVAKAITKRQRKLKRKAKKEGRYYSDEDFGENAKREHQRAMKWQNSPEYKKVSKLNNKEEELEDRYWNLVSAGKEKEAEKVQKMIEKVDLESWNIVKKNNPYLQKGQEDYKHSQIKAHLMDLGFNDTTADNLMKKIKKSKRTLRRYYLD